MGQANKRIPLINRLTPLWYPLVCLLYIALRPDNLISTALKHISSIRGPVISPYISVLINSCVPSDITILVHLLLYLSVVLFSC